ncbi:putative DNA endonuclease [Pseudomonas phage MR16]|uniref:Putative DNA endonuclease n=1 Tax=Pseudomonas phage MR5 TaxID=2711172 RepID=A0A6M3TCQ7_9CAUD|nr:putative DNA endonuclease [Pseudomonas phage MR5]QJD55337.1 putative DNA endonuclease [Pseudomonas phage MR18]QJF74601.1 putative DNA endonuclease [Pseudomonas phage MR16]
MMNELPAIQAVPGVTPRTALKPIPRTNMKAMTVKLLKDQGGLCPLCQCRIDLSIPREGVLDHDHESGEVRGVLHRSCNAAEGKVANAAGRWGAKGMSYTLIVPWLANLLAYYRKDGTGYMYPTHKTPEQKAVAARLKRNSQAAARRATAKVKTMSFKPKVQE